MYSKYENPAANKTQKILYLTIHSKRIMKYYVTERDQKRKGENNLESKTYNFIIK